MTEVYHYTGCGLDYVYLLDGYDVKETRHGKGVAIKDIAELHEAIALDVVSRPDPLRGQEVKFLRSMLRLSQAGIARVLRQQRGCVARWEADREKDIPGAADSALRMFYALKAGRHELAERLVDVLTELDELEHQVPTNREVASFRDGDGGWRIEPKKAA